LHFEVAGVSGANEYSVKPLLLASSVAPPTFAVFRPAAAAAAGVVLPLEAWAEVPDELHAARAAAAAAAAAGSTSSIRGRLSAPRRTSELIIAFSFATGPARAPEPSRRGRAAVTPTMPRRRPGPSPRAPSLMPGQQESRPSC
jgi:hypothetical protein